MRWPGPCAPLLPVALKEPMSQGVEGLGERGGQRRPKERRSHKTLPLPSKAEERRQKLCERVTQLTLGQPLWKKLLLLITECGQLIITDA